MPRMSRPEQIFTWSLRHPWLWMSIIVVVALMLPAVPIDETRYLTIAWEIHRSGDFIGLTLNGQPYLDKPPLLFWLVDMMWYLLGQSVWAARAVSIVFAAATVAVVGAIERVVADDDMPPPRVAPWILFPFVSFAMFSGSVMFDVPLCFFVACSLLSIVLWIRRQTPVAPLLLLISAALGMLMKGPVVFVHLIGPVVLIRWWQPPGRTYPWRSALAMVALLLIASLPLAWWAATAAARIDHAPVIDSLLHQAFGRVSDSFAHRRAPWWYLQWLPLFFLPWSLWIRWKVFVPVAWKAPRTVAARFGIAASMPALLLFSLISGKQLHYLLPLLPGVALYTATVVRRDPRVIAHRRILFALPIVAIACAWPVTYLLSGTGSAPDMPTSLAAYAVLGFAAFLLIRHRGEGGSHGLAVTAIASLCLTIALVLQLGIWLRRSPSVDELAAAVNEMSRRGIPLIALDDEPGMIAFLARLPHPLPVASRAAAATWATAHPDGFVLVHGGKSAPPAEAHLAVKLADGWEGLLPADVVQRGAY